MVHSLIPYSLVEITFFRLISVAIGGKFECHCLIWGIYAKSAKKTAGSSQLILSLILAHAYLVLQGQQI